MTNDILEYFNCMESTFPDGKIRIIDGRLIDCYPLATNEPDKVTDDTFGIDAAGRQPSTAESPKPTAEETEVEKALFLKNAFRFLANKERILTDSRMFLCRVPFRSGTTITGTTGFENPTLGVYIQWWMAYPNAARTDENGRKCLIYRLAGSFLTSANNSEMVYEDGTTEVINIYPFKEHCKTLGRINSAYKKAKERYQAYTLQQVVDILDHEAVGDKEYAHIINEQFHSSAINRLNERIEYLNAQNKALEERYYDALQRWKNDEILKYYNEYKSLEANINAEVEMLMEQKADLKAAFRKGRCTLEEYESLVIPINKRIKEAQKDLDTFKIEGPRSVFPDDNIYFALIEEFVKNIEKEQK